MGRDLIEIRFHGRGGQGAVTAANILVLTAYKNGLWGQAFPFFGAERRGAPVVAYARISRKGRVRLRSVIREPDVVVVLDDRLFRFVNVLEGLKKGGYVVINTTEEGIKKFIGRSDVRVFTVNATRIAKDLGLVLAGWPLVNTAMLGALARVLELPIDTVTKSIIEYLGSEKGPKNAEAAKKAYEEVREL